MEKTDINKANTHLINLLEKPLGTSQSQAQKKILRTNTL
jgi:uncharacterized protein YggU (UPF0235/DUF167 family)